MLREVTAIVKKCRKEDSEPGKPICLYTKDGSRLLGRHKDKQSAYKQEAAIKAHGSVMAMLDSQLVFAAQLKFGDYVEGVGETAFTSVTVKGVYLYPTGNFDLVFAGRKIAKPKGAIRLFNVEKLSGKPPANLLKQAKVFIQRSLPNLRKWMPKVADGIEKQLGGEVNGSTGILAMLDNVATLLDCRGYPSLATAVDTTAYEFEETRIEQLKRVGFSDELTRDLADANLADLVDDELEDELKNAGFTNNVLTRDEDVAKKIAEERIDLVDESAYYDLY